MGKSYAYCNHPAAPSSLILSPFSITHSVQEVKENEEYLVNFDCGGREIAINILLGSGFPNEKPKLIVSPILRHPWVNGTTGEIENAPGILNVRIFAAYGSHLKV